MIVDNKPYEYRLTYVDGDTERTHVFSAFCTGSEMKENLRHFLLACEWSVAGVDNILGEEEDE